jgi:hypothetical protein
VRPHEYGTPTYKERYIRVRDLSLSTELALRISVVTHVSIGIDNDLTRIEDQDGDILEEPY